MSTNAYYFYTYYKLKKSCNALILQRPSATWPWQQPPSSVAPWAAPPPRRDPGSETTTPPGDCGGGSHVWNNILTTTNDGYGTHVCSAVTRRARTHDWLCLELTFLILSIRRWILPATWHEVQRLRYVGTRNQCNDRIWWIHMHGQHR